MHKLKWLVLSLYSTTVFSQTVVKEYFDRHGETCSPESSYYYCIGKKNSRGFFYDSLKTFYSRSSTIRSTEIRDQFGNRLGNYESYYERGNLKSKSRYNKRAFRIIDPTRDSTDCLILEFRDSLGNVMVSNGEGFVKGRLDYLVEHGKVVHGLRDSVWTSYYENGKVYSYESWQAGQFVDGISYDSSGQEYYYKEPLVLPMPKGGLNEFYEQIINKINYPKDAERRGIEGKLIVEFLVEKDGTLTAPHVLKGLGFGCDQEATKALLSSPPWEPCKLKGQRIPYKMTIPFLFKLT